ncbi:MAG: Cys-tRNA(Pro) deacylase [Eubacteriales bacterium]|nr:Cys-tRNA(Pro) deacylase [Eubacteriales bacterium]
MRLLDAAGVEYTALEIDSSKALSGVEAAQLLNKEPDSVYKTLVCVSKSGTHYVFVVPSNKTLNLKKAAEASDEKSIAMIKEKELLPLTGYVHGGCSPIGMKQEFPCFLDESVLLHEFIIISAGKIGRHIEICPQALLEYLGAKVKELC